MSGNKKGRNRKNGPRDPNDKTRNISVSLRESQITKVTELTTDKSKSTKKHSLSFVIRNAIDALYELESNSGIHVKIGSDAYPLHTALYKVGRAIFPVDAINYVIDWVWHNQKHNIPIKPDHEEIYSNVMQEIRSSKDGEGLINHYVDVFYSLGEEYLFEMGNHLSFYQLVELNKDYPPLVAYSGFLRQAYQIKMKEMVHVERRYLSNIIASSETFRFVIYMAFKEGFADDEFEQPNWFKQSRREIIAMNRSL